MTDSSFAATDGSRTITVGEKVNAFLDEHPELAHSPAKIVDALGIKIGSAKARSKEWRDSQKLSQLGPILLQNIRLLLLFLYTRV